MPAGVSLRGMCAMGMWGAVLVMADRRHVHRRHIHSTAPILTLSPTFGHACRRAVLRLNLVRWKRARIGGALCLLPPYLTRLNVA